MARKPTKKAAKKSAKKTRKKPARKSAKKSTRTAAKKAPAKKLKAKKVVKAKARKPAPKPKPKARKAAPKPAKVARSPAIVAGSHAPAFNMPTDGGGSVSLAKLHGKAVVLYFYPRDDTPGCTVEACAFRDNLPDFTRVNATVIGVSTDGTKSHDSFKSKYSLPFTLGSDEDHAVAKAYGVWVEKDRYGKKYMGTERATFLIDARGKVVKVWRKVKVEGHAQEVLDAARGY